MQESLTQDILGSIYKPEKIHTRKVVPMSDAKYEITFVRKLLKANVEAKLIFEITGVQKKLRGQYHAVTITVDGFIRGEVECWLKTEEQSE